MHTLAPSCSDLLLFRLKGESINDLTIMFLAGVQTGALTVDQQNRFLSLKRVLRGLNGSVQKIPNPTMLSDIPPLDSNSKATLGAAHTKAKGGIRDEVSYTQPQSHMPTLSRVVDTQRRGKERGHGGK